MDEIEQMIAKRNADDIARRVEREINELPNAGPTLFLTATLLITEGIKRHAAEQGSERAIRQLVALLADVSTSMLRLLKAPSRNVPY